MRKHGNRRTQPLGAAAPGRGRLKADSTVEVWMFSEPVLLGTTSVDDGGAFEATLRVPAGLEPGEHTIQLDARRDDVSVRSTLISVHVYPAPRPPSPRPPPSPGQSQSQSPRCTATAANTSWPAPGRRTLGALPRAGQ